MIRRAFLQTSLLAGFAFGLGYGMLPAAGTRLGNHSLADFLEITSKAGSEIAALKPTGMPLSEKDKMLILEMAIGGMLQLKLSSVVSQKSTSEDIQVYARAEVEEQTGIAGKLKAIVAGAKNITLPTSLYEEGKMIAAKLEKLSGNELDREFLTTAGIQGHESLKTIMTEVSTNADDTTLKRIAELALPLIAVHLEVSISEAAIL